MKRSFSADQKGTYQARVDIFLLEDSRGKQDMSSLSISFALPATTDHMEKETFLEPLTLKAINE